MEHILSPMAHGNHVRTCGYLSHCANIDVYSGRTRDALLREIIPDVKAD